VLDAAALGRILPISNHFVEIRTSSARGRGLFAREPIAPGTLIEAAPVIILPSTQCAVLDRTVIYDYYFHWDGDPDGDGRGALGLGLLTLCNHSSRPRARVNRNYDRQTLDLVATLPIQPGEEVTIDYGCALWFEPRE
jgi:SET domain-containing protein